MPLSTSRVGILKLCITVFCLILVLVLFGFIYIPKQRYGFLIPQFLNYKADDNECVAGRPCVYEDVVDFRIIVITYSRAQSLLKLLRTIDEVELDGDKGALEIWIDVYKAGHFHNETLQVAKAFKWKRGTTRVHIHNAHVGIYGQWIDTWRPRDRKSKELALILEDDMSVSKYIYRWIKAVHLFHGSRNDFAGSTIASDTQLSHDAARNQLKASRNETVFMYQIIGTWGFSPEPSVWMDFQDWYYVQVKDPAFRPYVPELITTQWYKYFESQGKADSMWEQWFIYFAHVRKLWTIYNNLKVYNNDTLSCLSINRKEVGLHFSSKGSENMCKLLDRWDEKFITMTKNITKLDFRGKKMN